MNTINGSLDARIEGDRVYIRVSDCDLPSRATSELSQENIKTLLNTLEEALIRPDYPEIYKGRENENDALEQP